RAEAYPVELSGGQKQRVGIARALALNPKVLLSDEATSALDPEMTEQILDLLREINHALGLTIVLITHEMDVVRRIADHVTVLDKGRVAETGPTFDVFAFPQSQIGRSFLSTIVAHDLPPEVASRLHPMPFADSDPVVRIVLTDAAAQGPLMADLVQRFGVSPVIMHGRVDYVVGRPLGVLTLALGAAGDRLDDICAHLARSGLKTEVLGHVSRLAACAACASR
ncbi:MAG TPA: NIL domain-containing protein, partial [Paenirhodobacter sp.]